MKVEIDQFYNISKSQLQISANIIDYGSGNFTPGFCWDKSEIPTINSNRVTSTLNDGQNSFSAEITNLEPSTSYTIRAFLRDGSNIIYSKPIQSSKYFFNKIQLLRPDILKVTKNSIHLNNKMFYDKISDDTILDYGFCWAKYSNPDTSEFSTSKGSLAPFIDSFTYSDSIVNLHPRTTYFIKAYIKNNSGVTYSEQRIAITKYENPTISIDFDDKSQGNVILNCKIIDAREIDYSSQGVFIECWHMDDKNILHYDYEYCFAEKNSLAEFEIELKKLLLNQTYTLKPFLKANDGYYFSKEYKFTTTSKYIIF